jgi:flagellar hook-basal body complex protein FliE
LKGDPVDNIAIGKRDTLSLTVPREGQAKTGSAGAFSDVLFKAVSEVNGLNADKAIQNVQGGQADSLHEAIIALEKADVSFRAMLTVRNKLLEAYQEIMRMQV